MTEITHYTSKSKGPVAIAEMNPVWLANTANVLRKSGADPDTLAVMDARLVYLDSLPDDAARIAATTPGLPADHLPGANHPPAELDAATETVADPFEAHRIHIEDLYTEAKNWAEGSDIENDAQAQEVDRLINDFKAAIDGAEASRDEEIRPLTARVTAVRERYYPLIADTTKLKGLAVRAKTALLAVKTKWMRKVEAERQAEATRLARIAAEQVAQAVQASREAVGDIVATETAEDLIREARGALKTAALIAKPIVGSGMRDNWTVTGYQDLTDPETNTVTPGQTLAFRHYWVTDREAMLQFIQTLAARDIREGKRSIPGLVIENQRRAA